MRDPQIVMASALENNWLVAFEQPFVGASTGLVWRDRSRCSAGRVGGCLRGPRVTRCSPVAAHNLLTLLV